MNNEQESINFSLAHTKKWKDKEGNQHEDTVWLGCTIWRKDASRIAPHIKKGVKLLLEGDPSINIYKDSQGVSKGEFKMNVKYFEFLSSPKKEETTAATGDSMANARPQLDDSHFE